MSSATEIRSQVLNKDYATDKVVRIFTGSYGTSDLTARVGDLATAYVYRFAHGLNRPMMCEVMTSTDGGTTFDGGVDRIAFSDSTYVYIFDGYSPVISTVTYKVYCKWIDDFDTTNPSIESVMYSDNPKAFDSRTNYQKVYTSGVVSTAFGSPALQSVSHSLGYEPNYKVYFEAFQGEVWPLNFGGVRNGLLYDSDQAEAEAKATSTNLNIQTFNYLAGSTVRAWYVIYYDANEL